MRTAVRRQVVVALGDVDPGLVTGQLPSDARFVPDPLAAAARGVADVLAGRRPASLANPAWDVPGSTEPPQEEQ